MLLKVAIKKPHLLGQMVWTAYRTAHNAVAAASKTGLTYRQFANCISILYLVEAAWVCSAIWASTFIMTESRWVLIFTTEELSGPPELVLICSFYIYSYLVLNVEVNMSRSNATWWMVRDVYFYFPVFGCLCNAWLHFQLKAITGEKKQKSLPPSWPLTALSSLLFSLGFLPLF